MIDLHSKEFGAFDLIGKAFGVFTKHPGKYLGLLGLYILCLFAIGLVVGLVATGLVIGGMASFEQLSSFDQLGSGVAIIAGVLVILFVVAVVYVAIIYSLSMFHLIHQHLQGLNPTLKSVIAYARGLNMRRYIGLGLVKSIYLLGLTLLLIVPGIIYGIYWFFTGQIFVVEGLGYPEALDRSKQIVQGRWWNLFGKIILLGIMVAVIYGAGGWILDQLFASFSYNIGGEMINPVSIIFQQVFAQILGIVGIIYYMMIYINWKNIFMGESETIQEVIINNDSILGNHEPINH